MHKNKDHESQTRSVLATLRGLMPRRAIGLSEALRLAELQANRLLQLCQVDTAPVPSEIISELPLVRVVREWQLPVSGTSHWNGSTWIVTLNANEPWTRRRFTLMHEFKHIIDHGRPGLLYHGDRRSAAAQAERVADYFAGCVLMPKRLLKRAWSAGLQTPAKLAHAFHVSVQAAEVRLRQVGLVERRQRCQTESRTTDAPTSWPQQPSTACPMESMP